jgi:hypothetical protein
MHLQPVRLAWLGTVHAAARAPRSHVTATALQLPRMRASPGVCMPSAFPFFRAYVFVMKAYAFILINDYSFCVCFLKFAQSIFVVCYGICFQVVHVRLLFKICLEHIRCMLRNMLSSYPCAFDFF